MADVTISSLPQGTPSGNALLPYSQGSTTYSAKPSALSLAGVVTGDIIQTRINQIMGRSLGEYTGRVFPYSTNAITQTLGSKFLSVSITPKYSNSLIYITVNIPTISETANHSDHIGYGIWRDGLNTPINCGWCSPAFNPYPIAGVNHTTFIYFTAVETSLNTNTRTYSFFAGWNGGSGEAVINAVGSDPGVYGNSVISFIRVDEIAG